MIKRFLTIRMLVFLMIGMFIGTLCLAADYDVTRLGKGANCKWSPDGKYLAFTSSEGLMLYVVDSGIVRQVCPAEKVYYMNRFNYDWLSEDELIFISNVRTNDTNLISYDIKYITISLNCEQDTLHSEIMKNESFVRSKLKRLSNGKTAVIREEYINPASLSSFIEKYEIDTAAYFVISNSSGWPTRYWGMEKDSDIWLVKYNGQPYKRVTTNKTYGLPRLSPDGMHIICQIGAVILDLDGNVIGRFGQVELVGWLSDNKRVLYARTEENGYDIIASDLYIADITGKNEIQITDTPDKIELYPVISPDMTKIAYVDYCSDANYVEIIDLGETLK